MASATVKDRRGALDLSIERLIDQMLAQASQRATAEIAAWRKPEKDLCCLLRRDYVKSLRRHLGYRPLREMLSAANQMLTRLGRTQSGLTPGRTLHDLASKLRVHLRAEPCEGPDGRALRGFYMDKRRGILERPLIYVNTAHVPLAISVTLCHEFGHYVAGTCIIWQA